MRPENDDLYTPPEKFEIHHFVAFAIMFLITLSFTQFLLKVFEFSGGLAGMLSVICSVFFVGITVTLLENKKIILIAIYTCILIANLVLVKGILGYKKEVIE